MLTLRLELLFELFQQLELHLWCLKVGHTTSILTGVERNTVCLRTEQKLSKTFYRSESFQQFCVFVRLPVCLFDCLFIYLVPVTFTFPCLFLLFSVHLMYPSCHPLSIYLPFFVHPSIHPSIDPSIHPSIHISSNPISICPPVHPRTVQANASTCICICICIYL